MTESSITEPGAPDQADTRRRIWAIVGASSGNLVEWFDFTFIHSARSISPISFFHLAIPPPNCCRRQAYLPPVPDASPSADGCLVESPTAADVKPLCLSRCA